MVYGVESLDWVSLATSIVLLASVGCGSAATTPMSPAWPRATGRIRRHQPIEDHEVVDPGRGDILETAGGSERKSKSENGMAAQEAGISN
jgi:hypothetical protein